MLRLIKLIIWIAVIFGGIFFWKYADYENTILTQQETLVEITGWWFQSTLIDAGANPLFTKIYLSENTPDFQLQKWSYNIPANATVAKYIESLRFPINTQDINLTFLEGWNIFDIDEFLSEKNMIETWEFINFAENHNLASEYVFLEDIFSLEWYLYPDTYSINPNTFSVEWLARKMLNNFNKKIFQWLLVDADNETIRENIILSSIVEKEEKNPSEKSTVAGILKKRLEEGWKIGADITVCYPFRLTAEECKLSVTKYLYEVNDYNTRQKVWLPAGPIWNPSLETIQATLKSKSTPYYYYLHDTVTGKIYYGETNADHERNKQLYLR